MVGGKPAWASNNVEIFFARDGIFEGAWVFLDKITNVHLVLLTDGTYKGDEYPPLGQTSNWQLHSSGSIAPSNDFYDVTITPETTCSPTQVPTRAPSRLPTLAPTPTYLCVIITWDTTDSSYRSLPLDFYGSYYSNDISYPSNNEFSKFPIYPSTKNSKLVFTKKKNSNSISFFSNNDLPSNEETWVIDSTDHNDHLVSTMSNSDSEHPLFYAFVEGDVLHAGTPYDWKLYSNGALVTQLPLLVETSRSLDTCEMFDTESPTSSPTAFPTSSPSLSPSVVPTPAPSQSPSVIPTPQPSSSPSVMPSPSPTFRPTSQEPTKMPTPAPTQYPTLYYECINITAMDNANSGYNGVYTIQSGYRNNRAWFNDSNSGYNLYYVPEAVIIGNAWVLEGQTNDRMAVFDVSIGTWSSYGQSDQVPPYGTYMWKDFASALTPTSYDEINLLLAPLEECVPTQGPTTSPTDLPTTSTPAPTTPSPTVVPTLSPTKSPSLPPTETPTSNPTEVCRVLVIRTPNEPGGTSIFEGNYIIQSVFMNGKFRWYNSNTGYSLFFVKDDWLPSSWVFQGADGMDELAIFDNGTDGSPNTYEDLPDGEFWQLFYWGHHLQKRDQLVLVNVHCVDTMPPTNIPTPGPSPLPSFEPSTFPSTSPSALPSPAPSDLPSLVPSASPSSTPSSLPTLTPTIITTSPTLHPTSSPTDGPTRFPTLELCPCIVVNASQQVAAFSGMYQLAADSYNDHARWVNYDNLAEIYWADQAALDQYWVIVAEMNYAVVEDSTGRWGFTPPIGEHQWKIFYATFVGGGIDETLRLECTTCAPTPTPTLSPTVLSTPSPTTPSPTTIPTLSPSSMPSAVPSPSPTKLPTTLDPTPLSAEPTLMPSPSPTALPTSSEPSLSPSVMPSPSPSLKPSAMPTPSPTKAPIVPTLMPSPSPTMLPTTRVPSQAPSLMPSPSPTALPSTLPTPMPTQVPETLIPSLSPSLMPSPSPSAVPSVVPTTSPTSPPSLSPTDAPTSSPTVTCKCLTVEDPDSIMTDYVGTYQFHDNYSPTNTDKRMWERAGYGRNELLYFSQFGTSEARWVLKGTSYGEWAETTADPSEATPPEIATWLIYDDAGNFYQTFTISCSQCEVTPAPTPDPTEAPTQHPTTISPTGIPTASPTPYCKVLSLVDRTNGFYTGSFEMDVLSYNDRIMWTNKKTGESIHWADLAMFNNEEPVENIWMIGFTQAEGELDPHFLVHSEFSEDEHPPIDQVTSWKEYTYNEYSNQTSDVLIFCEETDIPTTSPTLSPTHKFCAVLHVKTCCDPVYSDLDGTYRAETHRGGKNMYSNSENKYDIYYTVVSDSGFWSIRSEDDSLFWVKSSEYNGPYPAWSTNWDLQSHSSDDFEVSIMINCSESFSPTAVPTSVPSPVPTSEAETLQPSKMPTFLPTNTPSRLPTPAPSKVCFALIIVGSDGIFDGTYSRLSDTKNGKPQWIDYKTGTDLYWIDRGIWANTWIVRAADGAYAMVYDNTGSLHPPLDDDWASLSDVLLQGDKYLNLVITCTTQPPAPTPTTSPTSSPTCEGKAILIEDSCAANITDGEYSGYYNFDSIHDNRKVFVRVDGEYEVLYNSGNAYAEHWMIRSREPGMCNEFWLVDGSGTFTIPPADAVWKAYGCACSDAKRKYECNFKVSCMQTMAPIPTLLPTVLPTPSPTDTDAPTPAPSEDPTNNPSEQPTQTPTNTPTDNPTEKPISGPPTQSPVSYTCINIDMQPCFNITDRNVSFYERTENQQQVNSKYYETKLYTEQKGYTFTASKDMVMYEAGMSFINLAAYQAVTVRVFDSSESLLFESDYSISGKGETHTSGTPRGDYYTFKNINVQLNHGQEYTIVFVIHCPASKASRAEYPLCAPHYELFAIDDFGTGVYNVYAYGEEYILPTQSDLYAPFIRICYGD